MLIAGAAANGLAVAAGAVAGCLLRKGIPDRISGYLSDGTALVVLYVGISGAVKGENVIAIILSFVLSVLAMTLITHSSNSSGRSSDIPSLLRKKRLRGSQTLRSWS